MNPKLSSLEREKALFLYSVALEKGDDATIERILEMAGRDQLLEDMIFEMHDLEAEQEMQKVDEASAAKLRELASLHLPSAFFSANTVEIEELPPVTVAQVIARIQSDAVSRPQSQNLIAEVVQLKEQKDFINTPLPTRLSRRALIQLFKGWELTVSSQLEKCFQETAIFLNMGRQQSQAQLAATRRQHKKVLSDSSTADENAQKENGSP